MNRISANCELRKISENFAKFFKNCLKVVRTLFDHFLKKKIGTLLQKQKIGCLCKSVPIFFSDFCFRKMTEKERTAVMFLYKQQ